MKKVAFVVSHLGSGSFDLIDILNKNPRCEMHTSNTRYDHPNDLNWLFKSHKLKDYSCAIYGDHLLYNTSFYCKSLYEHCKFIYVIRPARHSLNEILNLKYFYNDENILNYYKFRLRRICEMARATKDAVFITWDQLSNKKAFSIIEEYLNLVEPLKSDDHFKEPNSDSFRESLVLNAQNCYERYYYYLNNLQLRKVNA